MFLGTVGVRFEDRFGLLETPLILLQIWTTFNGEKLTLKTSCANFIIFKILTSLHTKIPIYFHTWKITKTRNCSWPKQSLF